jgi:hypothetical protein
MSNWTHSVCADCWKKMNPDRQPCRVVLADQERCCFCGTIHRSGIYVRKNPADMECNGLHEDIA